MKSVIGTKRRTNNNKTSFIINNKRIDNALLIANEFNKYFVSVGQTLDANLASTSINPFDLLQPNPCSMVFIHIEERDVATIINSLKNSSPGCDGIPATIAKRTIHLYVKILTLIINQAVYNGVFPKELKCHTSL